MADHRLTGTDQPQALTQKIKVVSIQLPMIGHATYGRMLRRALAKSGRVDFKGYWTSDHREVHARLFNRMAAQRAPIAWLSQRNLDLRRARAELGYAYFGRRLVQRAIGRAPVDVLHFHTQTPALLSVDYIRRIPTVISTDQTATQLALETSPRWQWTHFASVHMERSPLRLASAVVAFSQWAAGSLVDDQGVDPRRVHIIPPGVEIESFAELNPARVRSPGNAQNILFVGGDFERKGGPLLVDVFLHRFAAKGMHLHLLTKAKGIDRHPQISVHRDVDAYSPKWYQLFEMADIFALPTMWEAFGLAYIEAMAAAIPVIGTNISAVPEIVAHDVTGFLIPRNNGQALAEHIEALADDPNLRKRFGENGRQRVATYFDARVSSQRLERLFLAVGERGA